MPAKQYRGSLPVISLNVLCNFHCRPCFPVTTAVIRWGLDQGNSIVARKPWELMIVKLWAIITDASVGYSMAREVFFIALMTVLAWLTLWEVKHLWRGWDRIYWDTDTRLGSVGHVHQLCPKAVAFPWWLISWPRQVLGPCQSVCAPRKWQMLPCIATSSQREINCSH